MVLIRRNILRLLRIRSLAILTSIIVLLYLIKELGYISSPDLALNSEKHENQALHGGHLITDKDYFVPSSLKKIDWHMQDRITGDKMRVGIGEHGVPASVPSAQKEMEKKLYSENGFNGALSDLIALNRSLPDIRHSKCKERRYIESLPSVSVVVPFHDEHWSTLLRTVYSVSNRSPDHLIKEVFLVDDASTKDFLKSKLDKQLKHIPKVQVIRLEKRSGLITARLAGARQATGDVLIFLDSHTEANVNWLPPLLEPIALNRRVVVCPFIDVVAYDSFEYRAQDEGARGAFDWEFFYKRLPVLPKDLENMPEPFESPVMAGGLFAISRSFFWELGGYDPGLDIWGGEQYELSFKIWQCGGRMVDAPCSRVGHIFRKFAPFPNPGHGDFVGKNYRRVAEVWMDEYAKYLYKRRPHYLQIDPGDLTEQKKLKWKLKCKPFDWFIKQIAFDLTAKYPPVEPEPYAEGQISPASHPQVCVDAHGGQQNEALRLAACDHADDSDQHFVMSYHRDIKTKKRNMCWDLPDSAPKSSILLFGCHLGGGNQLWRYHPNTKALKQGSGTNCLDWDVPTRALFINKCVDGKETQKWNIETINSETLKHWDKLGVRVTGPIEDI